MRHLEKECRNCSPCTTKLPAWCFNRPGPQKELPCFQSASPLIVQEEISTLSEGEVRRREPAKLQRQTYSAFRYGASRGGPARLVGSLRDISAEEQARCVGGLPAWHLGACTTAMMDSSSVMGTGNWASRSSSIYNDDRVGSWACIEQDVLLRLRQQKGTRAAHPG